MFLRLGVLLCTAASFTTAQTTFVCTTGCPALTDTASLKCSGEETCGAHYVQERTHFRTGCKILTCRVGTLKIGASSAAFDHVSCEGNRWCGRSTAGMQCFDGSPPFTCAIFQAGGDSPGCNKCSEPVRANDCPPGETCDASKLTRGPLANTGCASITCPADHTLYAKWSKGWDKFEYVDCHKNAGWRLQSTVAIGAGELLEITCAKPAVCTTGCAPLTNPSLTCTGEETCGAQYIQERKHFRTGCKVNTCRVGTLLVGTSTAAFDHIACQGNRWCGHSTSAGIQCFDGSPPYNCAIFQAGGNSPGCIKCGEPMRASDCPPGKTCDATKLTRGPLVNTGCSAFTCTAGYSLFAKQANVWNKVEYVDCHKNAFWRLQSTEIMERGEITCAKINAAPATTSTPAPATTPAPMTTTPSTAAPTTSSTAWTGAVPVGTVLEGGCTQCPYVDYGDPKLVVQKCENLPTPVLTLRCSNGVKIKTHTLGSGLKHWFEYEHIYCNDVGQAWGTNTGMSVRGEEKFVAMVKCQ